MKVEKHESRIQLEPAEAAENQFPPYTRLSLFDAHSGIRWQRAVCIAAPRDEYLVDHVSAIRFRSSIRCG